MIIFPIIAVGGFVGVIVFTVYLFDRESRR